MALRLSLNERVFLESALRQDVRIDGRQPFDARRTRLSFSREDGAVEVLQGETRVLAVVSAQLGAPYPDRPNEGSLAIYTEFSPMADPSFEPGRPGEAAVELGRIIDRGLRESRAVDTESLCVLAGKAVWALRIDIHILDNGGNLVDVANMAALAGLLSFRRPECTVGGADGHEITVHPRDVREPVPLILHHLPIAVTFGFFADGDLVVLDPTLKEEAVMGGRLTLTVNAHGEVCAVQKGGGVGVSASEILRCLRIASTKASEMAALLKKAAEEHETERAQRKIRRHRAVTAVDHPKDVQMLDVCSAKLEVKIESTLEMDSPTDSEEEENAKPTDVLFQGGYSSWENVKPLDGEAMAEFEAAATVSASVSENKPVSAALVYKQSAYHKENKSDRPLGPVFPTENTTVQEPTSLLDAVKKKRKRKKASAN